MQNRRSYPQLGKMEKVVSMFSSAYVCEEWGKGYESRERGGKGRGREGEEGEISNLGLLGFECGIFPRDSCV